MLNTPINGNSQTPGEWFAVRVMSNRERLVSEALKGKGFDVCLPMWRQDAARAKARKERALFPGYVFCSFDQSVLLPILTVPGVVHIVGNGKRPEPVDAGEMRAVQTLAASGVSSAPTPYVSAGERIRVREGPLEGLEGVLVRYGNQDTLVISVSLLLRSLIVQVDRHSIEPIGAFRPKHHGNGLAIAVAHGARCQRIPA